MNEKRILPMSRCPGCNKTIDMPSEPVMRKALDGEEYQSLRIGSLGDAKLSPDEQAAIDRAKAEGDMFPLCWDCINAMPIADIQGFNERALRRVAAWLVMDGLIQRA